MVYRQMVKAAPQRVEIHPEKILRAIQERNNVMQEEQYENV